MSRNRLNGSITPKIGHIASLQFLDLSSNQVWGEIPASMSSLNFLEILDLLNNNLSGRIPHGTQLQGFDPSSYMGNPGLCGDPLPKCAGDLPPTNIIPKEGGSSHNINDEKDDDDDDDDDIFPGLYISVVLGFIVGFWGVCGTQSSKGLGETPFFDFLTASKTRFTRSLLSAWPDLGFGVLEGNPNCMLLPNNRAQSRTLVNFLRERERERELSTDSM